MTLLTPMVLYKVLQYLPSPPPHLNDFWDLKRIPTFISLWLGENSFPTTKNFETLIFQELDREQKDCRQKKKDY